MEKRLQDKRLSIVLVTACFIVYMIMSFTRNAYTAAIAGIIKDGVFSKTDAGVISSAFYVTYSLSQIIGSYFVDKMSPFKVIAIGLAGTFIANIAMSLAPTYTVIFTARAFCGLVQFGVWPALLKIVSQYINEECKRKAMYIMPMGLNAGTVMSLLIASYVLDYGKWQDLFEIAYILLGASGVIYFIIVWYTGKRAVLKEAVEKPTAETKTVESEEAVSKWKMMALSGALFICLSTMLRAIVASGIGSWMPTMMMECYRVSPGFSSMLSTITALSNFASVIWVILLYPRVFKNQIVALGMFCLISLPMIAALIFIGEIPIALVVILITLFNMFSHGTHQFYTVEIPVAYTKYNKAGMMAGIINVFACIGSMMAGAVNGFIAEAFGWNKTIIIWTAIIVITTALIFAAIPLWKKFFKLR